MLEVGQSIIWACFAVVGLVVSLCYRWRSFWVNVTLAGFFLLFALPVTFLGSVLGSDPGSHLTGVSAVVSTIGFAAVVIGFAGTLSDLSHRIDSLEDSLYAYGPRVPAELMDGQALPTWNERNEGSHDIQQ